MITTLLGLLTGLLGTAFTAYVDTKKAGNELELEKLRGENALALARMEVDKITAMEKAKITELVAVADAGAYAKSIEMDKATYAPEGTSSWVKNALGVIDVTRGAIRPLLTISTNLVLFGLIGAALWFVGPEVMKVKAAELIDVAIYLAISTGLWWFGVRVTSKGK
jgi:hypothetical protein